MSRLQGKKILLAITGSIAAYKSATLARLLIKEGAEVRAIMTTSAEAFIPRLTLSVLTKHEVHTDIFADGSWHNHVALGLWADMMIVAPCTANTLGKMAHGIADNMVMATYLSAKCPVYVAPAMDLDMWKHPSTINNLSTIQSYGNIVLPVGHGELASGLIGDGRMAEPEDIVHFISNNKPQPTTFTDKKVLITAGPTYEHIDPVRFIGNHSSGKMGIEIAEYFVKQGADVYLVLGPTHLRPTSKEIKVINVKSAIEMHDACHAHFGTIDIAIMAAAVADYRPAEVADEKIKKSGDQMQINLIKNPDIAASLGAIKKKSQIIVGFALETNDGMKHAAEKIKKKNLDMIVLNSLTDKGAGFGVDTNKVTFLYPNGFAQVHDLKLKSQVATDIGQAVDQLILDRPL